LYCINSCNTVTDGTTMQNTQDLKSAVPLTLGPKVPLVLITFYEKNPAILAQPVAQRLTVRGKKLKVKW